MAPSNPQKLDVKTTKNAESKSVDIVVDLQGMSADKMKYEVQNCGRTLNIRNGKNSKNEEIPDSVDSKSLEVIDQDGKVIFRFYEW